MAIPDNNPLDKKVQKVLQINLLDDKELQSALHALGQFYKENSLENRRFLRGNIESKNLDISLKFLDGFKEIKELMDIFDNKILTMAKYCCNIEEQISNTKKKTNEIIDEAKLLMSERQNLKEKSAFVKMFFQKYLLTPEELMKLDTIENNIDEEFINVVKKIICINAEGQNSLFQYNLSQDMVNHIAKENSSNYNKALDTLTKWTKDQCRLLIGDNVYIKPLLKKALLLLQPEAVSEEIYQELVMARRNSVNNLFINAMTLEGPGGVPKPIELHAHDPLRYVGDMLAWVHQFIMSESELLSSLSSNTCDLKHDDGGDGSTQIEQQHSLSDKMKALLADIMEGISRPLKMRIEQIIVSESKEVILFKLANVIQFYVNTLVEYLPTKSHFVCMLREMDQLTRDKLIASFSVYIRKLEEKSDHPSQDLYPTAYFSYILSIIKDMLSAKSAFMTTITHESSRELNKITEKLLNPLVQTVKLSSNHLENPIQQNVYQLNCFHHLYQTLKPNLSDIYTTEFVKNIEIQLDVGNKIESLAQEQAHYVLNKTGLTLLQQKFADVQSNLNQDLGGGQPSQLTQELYNMLNSSLLLFDQYLSAPDLNVLSDITLLQDIDIKETVLDKSCALILQTYELIYKELTSEANLEKEFVRSLLTLINQLKTPQQIAALL